MKIINNEACVSLETAKLLKQAGFAYECACAYMPKSLNGNEPFQWYYQPTDYNHNQESENFEVYSAPTLSVAQKWLREMEEYDINVLTDFDSVKRLYYVRYVVRDGHYKTYYITYHQSYVHYNTYEEALEAGINKALEIILYKG